MAKLLEVHGITKRFGGLTALNDLSFHVEEREVLGLMGPNGAGKTTFFSIIMGDYPADSGEIFFEGKAITKLPTYQRVRMGIARTYQVPRPFKEMTIFEDVRIGSMAPSIIKCLTGRAAAHDAVVRDTLEDVGLKDRLSMHPDELTMGDLHDRDLLASITVTDHHLPPLKTMPSRQPFGDVYDAFDGVCRYARDQAILALYPLFLNLSHGRLLQVLQVSRGVGACVFQTVPNPVCPQALLEGVAKVLVQAVQQFDPRFLSPQLC